MSPPRRGKLDMQIVPTYSAVLALIYIGLSYRAIRLRWDCHW
jgi:hypothetical protein